MYVYLLEFDIVYGCWLVEFVVKDGEIMIDGIVLFVLNYSWIEDLLLDGVDVVIDCMGYFKIVECIQFYFDVGVKKVVVLVLVKDGGVVNIVYGVNYDIYDVDIYDIIIVVSCIINCIVLVVKVIYESFGIKYGLIIMIYDVINM